MHTRAPRRATALAGCTALGAMTAFGSVALVATPQLAFAQSSRPCTEIQNDAERLACYDRSLRPAQPAQQPAQPAAQPVPRAAQPAARAPAAQPAREPVAEARNAAAAPAQTEVSTDRRDPRKGRQARAEAAAIAAATAAPSKTDRSTDEPLVPIVVVKMRTIPGSGDSVFTTDNGITWVQTDNSKLSFPEVPFNAQIKPGVMGSYFLLMEDRNHGVRVRRQN
jgi:hypothetical protein